MLSVVCRQATHCPMCRGEPFLRLYAAPHVKQGEVDVSCVPEMVGRLALSLAAPLTTVFLRRLQLWI